MVSKSQAVALMKKYKINPLYGVDYMLFAINVEMEHKNLIGNDPEKAFRIALDHIKEYPNYYYELKKMEQKLSNYWATRKKIPLTL